MTWNHRVFRQTTRFDGDWFTIREAFYDKDKETPHSWTTDAIAPGGSSVEELRENLERMLRALDKPVLDEEEELEKWKKKKKSRS